MLVIEDDFEVGVDRWGGQASFCLLLSCDVPPTCYFLVGVVAIAYFLVGCSIMLMLLVICGRGARMAVPDLTRK
jgi:hypothetical protein